jgi:integrase/recombinase XerD
MKAELQSSNFKYLLAGFTEWLQTLNMSEATITNYPVGLKEYFLYIEQEYHIQHINDIERKHSEEFKTHLQYRTNLNTKHGGICNQTINGILNGLNSFNRYIAQCSQVFKYAITADYLPIDVAEKIVLTENEVNELYNTTFEPYPHSLSSIEFGQRDRAIIGLLYGCGLRLNEARNVDLTDIDFNNQQVLVRIGKGKKQRFVPIPHKYLQDIKAYIQQGRNYFTERHHQRYWRNNGTKKTAYDKSENALLLGIEGTRLMSFAERLRYLKNKTGIQKNITPHVLRHTLGTHLYQHGVELDDIRKILGHTNIDTTQIYVHISKQLEDKNTET